MEKTYFEQLLYLSDGVEEKGDVAQYLFRDSLRRCLDYRDNFCEETYMQWQNSHYVKRNLDFINGILNK